MCQQDKECLIEVLMQQFCIIRIEKNCAGTSTLLTVHRQDVMCCTFIYVANGGCHLVHVVLWAAGMQSSSMWCLQRFKS